MQQSHVGRRRCHELAGHVQARDWAPWVCLAGSRQAVCYGNPFQVPDTHRAVVVADRCPSAVGQEAPSTARGTRANQVFAVATGNLSLQCNTGKHSQNAPPRKADFEGHTFLSSG